MCVKVRCVGRGADGITHIGGSTDDGTLPWGLTRAEAIQRIESNEWSFFVAQPAADPVSILVRTIGGSKVLTTARDDTQTNNLGLLPVCNPILSGADPQFPLSIPGPRQPTMVELRASGGPGVGGVLVNPDADGRFRIASWTTANPVRRLRVVCNAPFPADLEIYVERDPTRPDYVESDHKLTKVDSTSPGAVRALEDLGRGWYDWTLSLPDASYPHRFTPFIVPIGIPAAQGRETGFTLFIRNVSYNRYCEGPSTPLSVVVYRTTYRPPYTYPMIGAAGGTNAPPPREYIPGAFVVWQPDVQNIGQSKLSGPTTRLQVKSAADVGMPSTSWPEWGIYDDPTTSKQLCQHVGFAVLAGTGGGGAGGGIDFSNSGSLGVALAIKQPNAPGYVGDVLFRFVKLGAPTAQPMDVEGFITTPNATVTPRILLDLADQVALVIDANRFGGNAQSPGRLRLLDLGNRANSLRELEFDGITASAMVAERQDGIFEATITTNTGVSTVALPSA